MHIASPMRSSGARRAGPADALDARLTLETTIARASTGLVAIDDQGSVLAMSRPALELLGHSPGGVAGQPVAAFFPLLNATPLADIGYGHRALAVHADGSVLHVTVGAMRLAVTDFEGWILLLRADKTAAHGSAHH